MSRALEIMSQATRQGWAEVSPGSYLHTQETILSEQRGWDDEDEAKEKDFTGYPFWLVTDSGDGPFPVEDAKDLEQYL